MTLQELLKESLIDYIRNDDFNDTVSNIEKEYEEMVDEL